MNNRFFKGEDHQHFGLRKLSVGVASVLLGTTFMIYGGRTVQADTNANTDGSAQKDVTETAKTNDADATVEANKDSQVVTVNKQVQTLDVADNAAAEQVTDKAASNKATNVTVDNNKAEEVAKDVQTKDSQAQTAKKEITLQVAEDKKVLKKDDAIDTKALADNKAIQANEEPGQDIPSNLPVVDDATKEEYLKLIGLTQPDALTPEQLAAMGISRDTYLKDNVKYKATATAVVQTADGYLNLGNVPTYHNPDGSLNLKYYQFINQYIDDNFEQIFDAGYDIEGVIYKPSYAPYIEGKTIYINKGDSLTDDDARRGLPDEYENAYKGISWDSNIETQVDVNKVGEYDGAVDITYENGVGISTGVKVVVVDLTGKDEITHIGADIPAADKSVDGAPAGSQIVWTTEPSTEKAGKSVGTVTVTYPDGNKGTAKSTLNVLAPDVKDKVEVWQGDPVPDPDKMVTNEGDIASHLPGTTYTWGTPVDTTILGNHDTTIITHWPDGKTTSSSTVIVVNKHTASTDKGTKKTITRDIYTQLEGQEPKKVDTQTVTLTRSATEDLFTHEITYGEWSTANMAAYTAPSIENYTVENPDAAPAVEVTGSTDNMSITFKYKANHQEIVDGDGTHMDVSRDIYTQLEGQQPTKVDTETITLHRTGDKNLATGEIKWNAWQSAEMPAYAAPEIKNYTVTNPDAGAAVKVDGSTAKLADVVFDYKANHETITNGDGTEMTVSRDIYTKLEGQDAKKIDTQNVTLHRTGDKNLATGEITWGEWGTGKMDAYTAPEIKNYTVENPDAAPAVDITSSTKNMSVTFNYKANHETITTGDGTEKTVSRDIYTQIEGENAKKVDTETVTLHRTGDKNLATGEIKWNAWEPTTMPKFDAPSIAGYDVTNPDAAPAVTVDGSRNSLDDVVFNYAAQDRKQVVNYVDVNDQSNIVASTTVEGKTNTTVNFTPEAPKNWVIVPGQDLPLTISFGTADKAPITILVEHGHKQIKDADSKTISRLVQYIDPNTSKTVKITDQKVTLTRSADEDLVTGEKIYGAWSTATFDQVVAPSFKGYTVTNPLDASAIFVNANTPNQTVTFKYMASEFNQPVNYVEQGTDYIVGSTNVAGSTNSTVVFDADTFLPGNYQLAPNQEQNITIKFGDTQPTQAVNVYVVAKTAPYYGDTTMTVKRNIYTQLDDGTKQIYNVQNVTLTRTAERNLVTGKVTYSAWTAKQIPAFTAPEIPNYEVTNPDAAPAVTVDGSTAQLADVVFNYKAKHETITDGVGTHRTVTRDIYTQLEGQNAEHYTTQSITLSRTGDKNLATGEIVWSAWNTDTMPKFDAPEFAGYTVTNPDAGAAAKIDANSNSLPDVTFNYKANTQDITNGDGTEMTVSRDIYTKLEGQDAKKVDTQNITLHRTGVKNLATGEIKWNAWQSAEMPAYAAPEIKNYTVQNPNAGAAVTANGSTAKLADVVFDYKANHETITTGDGTEKTVSRDIYTQIEGQDAKKVDTETVTLHRTGDKNLATGEIKWNAWQSAEMPAYTAPEIKGYFVTNPDAAPAVTVDGSKDSLDKVVFHYNASDQKVLVNYVDEETHKTITSTTVNGKTGETVQFNAESHVPAGWTIVKGQTIPTSFTFGSTPLKDQTILIHHNENDRYKVSIPDGENVTTHVGANENVPSLSASGVKLVWTEDGKQVSAPAGVNVAWETVPATDKITTETGTLKITFKDGTTTTVNVPVNVQGATAGDLQTVDQGQTVPAAKTTVNTTTVDHFGITNIDWSKTPSTATPGAAIPGVARVHYSDGTYQDVNVVINVRGVEDGRDHKDQKNLYRSTYVKQVSTNEFGQEVTKWVNSVHYRIRYTDYKYPEGNPNRVTYSKWFHYIEE
ncbi:mucin-binding protein [Lactobacillus agrestimuris]|uniref:mucin-binding protein n=1 Tax=Lactobacillus agrestimuris TaxID=2941328 RepID=UPI002043BB3F|nr:Rib/alpha-like domain-containing protein [Lactobacillus agrestimuris]